MFRATFTLFASLFAFFGLASQALADASAMDRCVEVRNKLDTSFWNELRNAADKTLCRRPWSERTRLEFMACGSVDLSLKLGLYLKVGLNAYFDRHNAEWATLGPRYVGSNDEQGTIQGGFKRTFIGAGMPYVDSEITVEKRDGKAEGIVTVCQIALDGARILQTRRFTFANGNDNIGRTFTVTLPNTEVTAIGIVVDTPASLNSFAYSTRLRDLGGIGGPKAKGLADLHLHEFADLGFGGRIMMGESSGPKSTALAKDQISPGSENLAELGASIIMDVVTPPSPVKSTIAALTPSGLSIDANILLTASQLKTGEALTTMLFGNNSEGVSSFKNRDEDGFFQVGMPGGGSPSFTRWPNHADRSHQQAHIDWLKAAHDRGLNLVVVSLVNSPFLCNIMNKLDAFGNVAEARDGQGRITRWKSHSWDCDTFTTINREIDAAQALDRELDWYEIVMNPAHARQVIKEGHLAVVLSIESDGMLNTILGEGDFEDELLRLRGRGVSTLQIVHERDSRFCGLAPHRDELKPIQFMRYRAQQWLTHPASIFGDIFNPEGDHSVYSLDSAGRNRIGLKSPDGVRLINLMMDQGMPIDLAHTSVQCRRDVFAQIEGRSGTYGLYDSHTKFERMINPELDGNRKVQHDTGFVPAAFERDKEFMVTQDILPSYKRHHVMVGLRTGPVDSYSAPPRSDGKAGVANTCPGSSRSYAQLVDFATDQGLDIAFGSDINGLIAQLGPRFGEGRCYAAHVPGGIAARAEPESTEHGVSLVPVAGAAGLMRATAAGPVAGTGVANSQPKAGGGGTQRPMQAPASAQVNIAKPAVLMIGELRKVPDIDGTNYFRDGLVNIAWLPEVYEDLKTLRTPGVEALENSAESYIQMWERAWVKRK
ncbi:MAG: hypothetical protein RL367_1073 [Pseudomonadota bacterium]